MRLKEVIRLALNTWADVTLLAVSVPTGRAARPDSRRRTSPWPRPCTATGRAFLASAAEEGSPYALGNYRV